ncbi:MAG: hypothetical protein OXE48_06445 [Gammaproteobacteria bacterium]|nr:hypothetical protein [Gammaproteobacteria bacterium]
MIAVPAVAQVNTVGLMVEGSVVVREEPGCLTAGITLTSTATIPTGTQVRYHVSTESGYNYFRNHGVEVFLGDGETLSNIPSSVITANTAAAGTSVLLPNLCVADDRIDPRPDGNTDGNTSSIITIRLMSVAGFTIDRNRASARAFIRGDDRCNSPNSNGLNGGIVYKFRNGSMNDSCVCSNKSLAAIDEPHDRYRPLTPGERGLNHDPVVYGDIPTYGESSLKWLTDTTDYCKDSPYQKPGG